MGADRVWAREEERMAWQPLITSPTNPRIKAAQKLQRRRARHEQGRLLVEGVRLVQDAWEAGVRPETLFFAADLADGNTAAGDLVAALHAAGVELVPCTPRVFAELAETQTPQGIAAILPLPELPLPPSPDLLLILDRVRDPGNAGTLLRTAEAAGVQLVLFGPETVDPFNDKVVRAGMGAHFRVPLRVCPTWEATAALIPPGRAIYLADGAATLDYADVDWRAPSAVIVGGEATGASTAARAAATPIAVPMLGRVESLNAAVAGAVILFEAARSRRMAARLAALSAR
jgi:TrmH family RNA methyltransferase